MFSMTSVCKYVNIKSSYKILVYILIKHVTLFSLLFFLFVFAFVLLGTTPLSPLSLPTSRLSDP